MDNIPWVDKYRPRRINSIIHQDEVKKVLKETIETGELPNLLFYGPPGSGKTSAILALGYELFGPELMNERILELNASDERGIDTVREKIISFAKEVILHRFFELNSISRSIQAAGLTWEQMELYDTFHFWTPMFVNQTRLKNNF